MYSGATLSLDDRTVENTTRLSEKIAMENTNISLWCLERTDGIRFLDLSERKHSTRNYN